MLKYVCNSELHDTRLGEHTDMYIQFYCPMTLLCLLLLHFHYRFQELGFEVQSYDDLDEKNMMDSIQKGTTFCRFFISNIKNLHDHKDADCFVCVFLSHGDEDHIFANDKKVDINRITDLFRGNECESLVGKPKIFIIQMMMRSLLISSQLEQISSFAAVLLRVSEADMNLLAPWVMTGIYSWRMDCNFYIQDLCETLKQQGSTLEFTKLLTLVNMKVSSRTQSSNKQMPCFTSMLTKKLYFRPKEEQMSTPSGSSSIKS
uniref:Caspase-6 n=1 Tax=Astyanax mexicanus TaxID=7994 RepID=A0A8B9GN61_ASTMX